MIQTSFMHTRKRGRKKTNGYRDGGIQQKELGIKCKDEEHK